ncbi:MAG: DHH family phosphoesterase [Patescibacteria group bacterium]
MLGIKEQIFNQIEKSKFPLIIFSADWNGDDVASSLALFLLLKKLGKEAEIVGAPSSKSKVWSFLPAANSIKDSLTNLRKFIVSLNISQAKVDQIKYVVEDKSLNFIISPKEGWFNSEDVSTSASGFKHDLIITVGAGDLESLGKLYDTNVEFFYKTTIINIDCRTDNEEFGQINYIDANSVSTAELVFGLLTDEKVELIDEDVATCLLAGIISKTKNFKNTNLTPDALLTTSKLINLGARREEIINNLYRSRNFKTLKLWGKILNNLNSELNSRLIWATAKKEDFINSEASEDSVFDIIDELIVNIPEAKLIVVIFENLDSAGNKAIIYSVSNINTKELLKEYSPEGNAKSSKINLAGDLQEASTKIIELIKNKLEKINK